MHYKGITVELIDVAGQAFKEYKDTAEYDETDEISHALIEVPASDQNQAFMVRCTVNDASYFHTKNHALLLRCIPEITEPEVDKGAGKFITRANKPKVCEGKAMGYDPTTNQSLYKRLNFAALDICEKASKTNSGCN